MNKLWLKVRVVGILAVMAALAAFMISDVAVAKRGKGRGGPDPERKLKKLTLVLDLTEAQQAAILPILQNEAVEIKAVREKYRGDGGEDGEIDRETKKQKRQEIREIHERYSALVEAQLDDAQAEKYRKLKELKRNKKGKGPKQ